MSLAPLLQASWVIQLHAWAALTALVLGPILLLMEKGTRLHRRVGRAWVAAMIIVCLTAFGIHGVGPLGRWSVLHFPALFTLGALAYALWQIRRGNRRAHGVAMIQLFLFALVVTGLFTLLPGRIMHAVVLGG